MGFFLQRKFLVSHYLEKLFEFLFVCLFVCVFLFEGRFRSFFFSAFLHKECVFDLSVLCRFVFNTMLLKVHRRKAETFSGNEIVVESIYFLGIFFFRRCLCVIENLCAVRAYTVMITATLAYVCCMFLSVCAKRLFANQVGTNRKQYPNGTTLYV